MAYDTDLANRIREALADETALHEKAMFGGLAFMIGGNMAVGVTGNELMVRVGLDAGDDALAEPHTRPFDMTGRPMKGWVLVAGEGASRRQDLEAWVRRGADFAHSLPPKG